MPPRPVQVKPNSSKPSSTKQSVWDRIEDIGFEDDDTIQTLVYGRSGTGKTTFWGSFPKPILALVCSGGLRTGELRPVNTKENKGQIKPIRIKASTDVIELANGLQKETRGYKTLVLDHASGLQDLILKEILGLEEIPVAKTWGMARQQDYAQCTLQAKEILRLILNCPLNICIVAQEREFNNDGDQSLIAPTVGAGLMPQLCGWLNTAVDYIVHTFIRQKIVTKQQKIGGKIQNVQMKTKDVEYCLRTAPDPVYTTKFRLPKGHNLPREIVDPDYEKIMQTIAGANETE